ncbi:MAG: PTS IIA-like nitrogen regulatory protein PtsN [Nitrosomonadaceae bacterium]
MNLITQLLPLSHVIVDLEAASKKRVFEQVGLLFENTLHIARNQIFDSLFAREKLGSTGLGQGVAIPHGRIKGLHKATAAFVRMKESILFDAPDGRPVDLICILLVPEKATDQHLQILSELAQMFSVKSFRESLLTSKDAGETHQLISNWAPNVPDQHNATI